jgi:hypothetical protein
MDTDSDPTDPDSDTDTDPHHCYRCLLCVCTIPKEDTFRLFLYCNLQTIQEFLSATEGELYVGAKSWCLRNTR